MWSSATRRTARRSTRSPGPAITWTLSRRHSELWMPPKTKEPLPVDSPAGVLFYFLAVFPVRGVSPRRSFRPRAIRSFGVSLCPSGRDIGPGICITSFLTEGVISRCRTSCDLFRGGAVGSRTRYLQDYEPCETPFLYPRSSTDGTRTRDLLLMRELP